MKLTEILKPKTEAEIQASIEALQPVQKLLACAQFGRADGVKDAIEKGVDINSCTEDDPSTALDLAIGSGNFVIAKYLLDQGASVGNYALCDSMEREDIFVQLLDKLSPDMCSRESLELVFAELEEYGKDHLIQQLEDKIQQYYENR